MRVSVSKVSALETLNIANEWFIKISIFQIFLFVVFAGKKQPKHDGKCHKLEQIRVRSTGVRRNISRGGKLDILLILSMLLTIHTMSMHVHKTLCPFYTITKIPPATRGRDEGGKGGHNSPGTESLWRRHKVPTMSQILSSIHLLPKDLRFEHRGAKPLSCPGRHLASLCPCCFGSSRTKSASLAQQRFFFIHPSFHTAQY